MATWRPSLLLVRAPAVVPEPVGVGCCSVHGGGLPAKRGELARACDRDRAGRLATICAEVSPACVQTTLCAPGDRDDAWVLAGLASGELEPDARTAAVMMGGLDQQPARVRRPGLGDCALYALAVRAVLARDDSQKPRQQAGPGEALKVADLGAQPGGRERVDPAKAAQSGDRFGVGARRDRVHEHG